MKHNPLALVLHETIAVYKLDGLDCCLHSDTLSYVVNRSAGLELNPIIKTDAIQAMNFSLNYRAENDFFPKIKKIEITNRDGEHYVLPARRCYQAGKHNRNPVFIEEHESKEGA